MGKTKAKAKARLTTKVRAKERVMVKEKARARAITGILHRKAAGDTTLGIIPPRVREKATILGKPHPRARKEVAMIVATIEVMPAAATVAATTVAMTMAMSAIMAKGKAKVR